MEGSRGLVFREFVRMQLKLVRVRPGEREGRGRTGSPLRPVGTRLGADSDGASIWGFGKLRPHDPRTQSGVVGGLGLQLEEG